MCDNTYIILGGGWIDVQLYLIGIIRIRNVGICINKQTIHFSKV